MIAGLRRVAWATWRPIAERAARAYVAGPDLGHALATCRTLARDGMPTTICPWDGDGDSPRQVADTYLAAVAGLTGAGLDCHLSIKAPSLGFSSALLAELGAAARRGGIGVHFDSLGLTAADPTWALIREMAAHDIPTGCTLPARWCRSLADVDQAVELGVRVRVVKGQWADPAVPEGAIRAAFLALVDRLAGRARQVAVATHDPALIRPALEALRRAATPCELELLFGLPARAPLRLARASGVPVRFYVPYGKAWLPYSLSQLRRHPRVVWWTMRDWLLGWGWPGATPSRA
ncbi:MAG TPA: hypothetical protein VEU55_00345 [Gemmatimonadales bacterium]|nr:hypothetical protein [Gemmatimonadales bacterium]